MGVGGTAHLQLASSWEGKAALAGFYPSIKENRSQVQPRAGQDVCGVQQLDSLLTPPAQLSLMSSNSVCPGQAVCNQHFNSLWCVGICMPHSSKIIGPGSWNNAILERGLLPRKEHELGHKSLSLKGIGLHSGQTGYQRLDLCPPPWESAVLLTVPHPHSPPLLLSVPMTGCVAEDVSGT